MAQVIYTVVEDNGGGLHLCILANDSRETCTHVFSGWENDPTNLTASLAALNAGEADVNDWDNAEVSPQALYDNLTDGETLRNGGAKLIADEDGAVTFARMGHAGRSVFYPSGEEA